MNSLTLTEAKNKRTQIKASMTRLRTYIESFDMQQGSRHDIKERKQKLTELWHQFENVQSQIELLEMQESSGTNKDAVSNSKYNNVQILKIIIIIYSLDTKQVLSCTVILSHSLPHHGKPFCHIFPRL